jgi:hypothetical protein
VGNPSESVPRARNSGGSHEPRLSALGMRPSVADDNVGFRDDKRFRSSIRAARSLACLRFTSPVVRRRCKTHYRPARYSVDRAGFSPAGFHSGVSRAHIVPPLPRFRGATSAEFSHTSASRERQACSGGASPSGAKVRSPVAWVASVE